MIKDNINGGGGSDGGCGSGGGTGVGTWAPSPTLGVRECLPPPFLINTYKIVNDPNTNSIISWNALGDSFIIWDHLKFSAELLPKYFKHSNFTSFLYQLSNYGFRKIGVDHQWEYENPYFKVGNEYLLTNIKRRNQKPQNITQRGPKKPTCCKMNKTNDSAKLELLKNGINESKMEIQKIKKQQEDIEFHIVALEADIKNTEHESQRLITVLEKVCNEIFVQKLTEESEKESSDNEIIKKRKFDHTHESSMGNTETNVCFLNQEFNGNYNHKDQEMDKEDTIPLTENQSAISSTDNSSYPDHQDLEANGRSEPLITKNLWGDLISLEKILLEDDEICENENRNEILEELEDLISKQAADQETEKVSAGEE